MRRNVFTTYDPNLPSGKKFVAVHVQNEDPLYFLVEVKSKVCELFAQITKFLNLLEPELFGLAIRSSGSYVFLDQLEKLSKYAPKPWRTQNNGMDNEGLPLFNVYFRVQYYVDSYLFISDKVAKLLYYHQMRENVLYYRQAIAEERAFLLASFALQADYGNYNGALHTGAYFEPRHYFPAWVLEERGVEYIIRHLPALHSDHKGMSKSEAQSMYIKEASDPIGPHNFHFYALTSKKGVQVFDVWLAITIAGIAIYGEEGTTQGTAPSPAGTLHRNGPKSSRLKARISFFAWSDIGKLSFEKKKFEIRSTGPQGRKFVYSAVSEELSRHLLWFSRASHQFHLMVQQKMKEMLKREAEISRRKYRESCISSTSSSTSSSGNSSGAPSSGATSKSASPFEAYSSSSSTAGPKGTSDLDTSASSVCGTEPEDSHSHSEHQRISVLSQASSNTTSGIVSQSDKVGHSLEDSDREADEIDSDLLMSLSHRHHQIGRAITLSGCSPQPVVSLESLALSEPIDSRSCRTGEMAPSKRGLAANKKHSVSISNIMITSSTTSPASTCGSMVSTVDSAANEAASSCLDAYSGSGSVASSSSFTSSSLCAKSGLTSVGIYSPTDEVLITGANSSKVLCLNINESPTIDSTCCSLSPYDHECSSDDSSLYDEVSSTFDSTNKSYTSGKSNVTVLSTILKPEAERLMKAGYEADDAEMMIDDGIDSLELAELKEFEQAEKEKIILNSLIHKLPPPPPVSSSESDSSDDEDDDRHSGRSRRSCYSPLTQERMMHKLAGSSTSPRQCSGSKAPPKGILTSRTSGGPKSVGAHKSVHLKDLQEECRPSKYLANHIYENLKMPAPPQGRSLQVEALVTPRKAPSGLPPALPLRPAPSLNALPNGAHCTPTYAHRTGMRIGVSSLNRPYGAARAKLPLLAGGGCGHTHGALLMTPNGPCCSNLFDTSTLSAGSEPNLYFQSNNAWPQTARGLPVNKSDSVYDCRLVAPPAVFSDAMTPTRAEQAPSAFATPYRPSTNLVAPGKSVSAQDSNNNIEKIYRSPGGSPTHLGAPTPTLTPPTTSASVASHKTNRSREGSHLKASEGSITDLHQLRQRSSDLNLPLITALFNDSSLMDQLKANEATNNNASKMSQSLQQIPQKVALSGGAGVTVSGPHPSGATVERTSTFKVDEAIAKSTLRQAQHQQAEAVNDDNNNQPDYASPSSGGARPTSWHLDNSCSGRNRLFPVAGSPYGVYSSPGHLSNAHQGQSHPSPQKLYTSDFVERLWAEHQLTT